MENIDKDQPFEIAERVWWVGTYLPDEFFQCHVYLIEHGDQSVLFDPGSQKTFPHTLDKINKIIPFSNIRYFVCHHQDPDITSTLPSISKMNKRDDAFIISHWRAEVLLKHYDLNIPFWLIEEHDWELDLGGRVLKFIFTPYLHFPGAFCTFDTKSGTLFSSDLFGGFTDGFQLYAKNEGHFEKLRPFHEHYMPSREILQHSLNNIQKLPLNLIAPQHGSIIPKWLIDVMIEKLKALDCGLFLMAKKSIDVKRLSLINNTLREIAKTMILYRDFRSVVDSLLQNIRKLIPAVTKIEFIAKYEDTTLIFNDKTRYRGTLLSDPGEFGYYIDTDRKSWEERFNAFYVQKTVSDNRKVILIPLFSPVTSVSNGMAILSISKKVESSYELKQLITQICSPLQVAVEREVIFHVMDQERQKYFEKSIKCPLTNMFTRVYMYDIVKRLLSVHNRNKNSTVGLALLDIDFFKKINDTYGHNMGDEVLKKVAGVIIKNSRSGDIPVRLGGEEFAVFIVESSESETFQYAEKMRQLVESLTFEEPMKNISVTISIGVAIHLQQEKLEELIHRADMALYEAKESGRNRVCKAK